MDPIRPTLVIGFVFLSCFTFCHGQTNAPTIQTTKGSVTGMQLLLNSSTSTAKYVNVYRGIPYAQPPVGALRFKPPVEPSAWVVTKALSTLEAPRCPQPSFTDYNEDCLYINVYTPGYATVPTTTGLPVMVWIHGGGFVYGSGKYSDYGPDFFLDNDDIIYVSFNYRLGALGFLSLGNDDAPGNVGLKDQVLALKWVKSEIAKFGGDPNKVTVFGESAGAISTSFHYISPLSQGLFSKAICESGVALIEQAVLEQGFVERATVLATRLGCVKNGTVVVSCMQNVNVDYILGNQSIPLSEEYTLSGATIAFPPTLEENTTTAFLPATPLTLLQDLANKTSNAPLIMGINRDEGTVMVTSNISVYSRLSSNIQYMIPSSIRNQKKANDLQSNIAEIKSKYFNNIMPNITNLDGYIKIYGDKMFGVPTSKFARDIVNFTNVYLYYFNYSGTYPKYFPTTLDGSTINLTTKIGHSDELSYLFYKDTINQTAKAETDQNKITLRKMVKLWTNFVKYGDPTYTDNTTTTLFGNTKWSPISKSSLKYLNITTTFGMSNEDFLENEVSFWNRILTINTASFGFKMTYSVVLLSVCLFFKLFL
uniref:Carboxylic ester hydrolase n=1 Tax=Clastoptera arizonana TaxID=38151 RepID=A0A1B6CM21_9HEMI